MSAKHSMSVKHNTSKLRNKEDPLAVLRKKHPRLNFNGSYYYEICSEARTLVKQAKVEVKRIFENQPKNGKLRRPGTKYINLSQKIRKQESVAIAFAAMCLEACIWDYAACNTSQNKTKDYFGTLNLVGKWVLIPQLLCGSDITKVRIGDTSLLGRLRDLKEARNKLVHPKSKPLPDSFDKAVKVIRAKGEGISAEDAFGLIRPLLGELEKVDKTNWWFFQTYAYRNSIKKLHESSVS